MLKMLRRKPDLIVPIRDRRQRKRYLTLRNFGYSLIAALVIFLGITIRSEMRGVGPTTYGRLVERELPQVEQKQKPVEVVTEATPAVTNEQTHADPMLMEPMAREQWLRDQSTAEPVAVAIPHRAAAALATGETDVAIVGGPEGVKIVQRERRKPVLSGGFGRQQ
ncbi:MAG TPA: hypothetical protein VFV49_14600 [Thermoanaerobaculia bacterium]|nr:hypothetical protein [Thermoanaerobaculia bacterium]